MEVPWGRSRGVLRLVGGDWLDEMGCSGEVGERFGVVVCAFQDAGVALCVSVL